VVVLEKGCDVSYAACGMPYNLFYRDTPVEDLYALSFDTITGRGIDCRLRHEVVAIDPLRQEVSVLERQTGREYRESYDFFVYATGNRQIRLDLPGFGDDNVFAFRNLDETRQVKAYLYTRAPKSAVLVGAGYTNLEVADVLINLKVRPVEGYSLELLEREVVVNALERNDLNQAAAARFLRIPRHTLIYRLEKYGITLPEKKE
jgi:NADPH-dependent 2,4-dienoyl-CoA reductase/sulfur reductase-like enzyme